MLSFMIVWKKKRKTLYIPISITIFNLIDGFSKNNDVRLMDNYHIVYPEGKLAPICHGKIVDWLLSYKKSTYALFPF